MKKSKPYKIWYNRLSTTKITVQPGDELIVYNPNFSKTTKDIVQDIFEKLHIGTMEYEYRLNYQDSSISIHFGTLI